MNKFRFSTIARRIAILAGRPTAFLVAVAAVVLWALSGPVFGYTDTWQLVINTTTTIVTFLMVFLIQNTQNRDAEAIHLKLDEIIKTMEGAHNALLDLEELEEADLDRIREHYERLARQARGGLRQEADPEKR